MPCIDMLIWASLIVLAVVVLCKCNKNNTSNFTDGMMQQLGSLYGHPSEQLTNSINNTIPLSRFYGSKVNTLSGRNTGLNAINTLAGVEPMSNAPMMHQLGQLYGQ